jgi:hypothetical protein
MLDDTRIPSINPQRAPAYNYFDRSVDTTPGNVGGGGGTNTSGDWPLKLVAVDTENVKVLLGTISGTYPTDVATNIDVSGTDGTWYFFMHATLSGTSVTAVSVESDLTGGMDSSDDDATNSYRPIGQVVVASSVITSVSPAMNWSQTVVVCTADTPPYQWVTGS